MADETMVPEVRKLLEDKKRTLAGRLAQQLRQYMREKTSHNNIIAIPVFDLWMWASKEHEEVKATSPEALQEAAELLHQLGLCTTVIQGLPNGSAVLQIKMRDECRDITDDAITTRLFPDRS